MAVDPRPGRMCPLRYRYSPEIFARSAQLSARTVYVIGGLYGNPEALDTVLAMAEDERRRGGDVTLIFNGDFHWLDIAVDDFVSINQTVLRHTATQGNVEAELAAEDSEAGCGCAYPDSVPEAVVARSNDILMRLRATAAACPDLRRALGELPMTLTVAVGDERVAVLHGDPESLAGWNLAVEAMPPDGATPAYRIEDYFRKAGVGVFACTHTGLPYGQRFKVDGHPRVVINNGSAGMPNFADSRFGVITRISADERIPETSLYGCALDGLRVDALPVPYDHDAWLRRFRRSWPEDSPAHLSYHDRIVNGPPFTVEEAARDGMPVIAGAARRLD